MVPEADERESEEETKSPTKLCNLISIVMGILRKGIKVLHSPYTKTKNIREAAPKKIPKSFGHCPFGV